MMELKTSDFEQKHSLQFNFFLAKKLGDKLAKSSSNPMKLGKIVYKWEESER